jgi:tetratricopeptide (TPR) repeat protein
LLALERGHLAFAQGDPQDAEVYFRLAVREAQRSEGPDSLTEGWAQLGLGHSLRLQGDSVAARGTLLRALAIHRGGTSSPALRPAHTPGVIATLTELAALERDHGQLDAARAHLVEALDLGRTVLGAAHPRVAPVLAELSHVELAGGDAAAAVRAARRSDEIASRLPDGHVTRVESARVLAGARSAAATLTPP